MAVDEAILSAVSAGRVPPTLRLYAWSPACLSLGYGQAASDVDVGRLSERGWTLVRRPTGGRAILHADELTYCVALPRDHPLAAGSVLDSYRRLSAALLVALRALGVPVEVERRRGHAGKAGPVCFEVSSPYEITFENQKLVGSAQLRRKYGLLQHGSMPLTGDVGRICDVLTFADEAERAAARQRVRTRGVTLAQALKREVTWHEAATAFSAGFATAFGVELVPGELTPEELDIAWQLERDVYTGIDKRAVAVFTGD